MTGERTKLGIRAPFPERRPGAERFKDETGLDRADMTLEDFWTWAFSDLRENTTRGILAEYIVGKALGANLVVRQGWWNWDLETPEGIRVEVKSTAYLQAWPQARFSRLSFGKLRGRAFNAETGEFAEEAAYHADVYVFAVQTCREHSEYDPLDSRQWRFWILPRGKVEETGSRSLTLSTVRAIGAAEAGFGELAEAVRALKH